jgi:glycerol kinase
VEWSAEACELFGLDPSEQPAVVACDEVVGETDAFGDRLRVSGLCVDQQAALFAESCFEPGEAKCTYGTGAFILANAGTAVQRSASRLAACVAWRVDGTTTYCLDGQIYTAGSAVSWLRELGLIGDAGELDAVAGDGMPAADAPVFVPALAGLGTPYWAPQARGGWVRLSLATRSEDLVRALVWGIAAQVATLAAAMGREVGRPLERLRVDGGLTRSRALMQAQSDLLQIPVELYPSPDATALGVGAFARLGANDASSPGQAVGDWTPTAIFEPRISADEAAERLGWFDAAARAMVKLGDGSG